MKRILACVLILVGVAVYANSLDAPFVFDDEVTLVENTYYRDPWPLWRAFSAAPEMPVSGRPVVCASLALNYKLSGSSARGFHAFNLAVHIACALVLFGLVRLTLLTAGLRDRFARDALPVAFVCALLWMTHPLTSECVNYITQRTESMMALFYLSTLYCLVRGYARGSRGYRMLAVASCALAMGCKEAAVTAPVVALLYDRTFLAGSFRKAFRERWGLHLALGSTWLVLAVSIATGSRWETVGFSHGLGPLDYLKNQCVVLVEYLRLVLWPHPLALDYGYPVKLTFAVVWPQAVLLSAVALASLLALFRRPRLGFLCACFFLVLAPSSSFLPIATEVGADRRMYLPLAALVTLGVVGVHAAVRFGAARYARPIGAVLATGVVLVLSALTFQRNAQYRDEVGIWRSALAARPDNPRAHANLGWALTRRGEPEEGEKHFRAALRLVPAYAEPHYNLGIVLSKQGRPQEAVVQFREALRLRPSFSRAHAALGVALASQGKLDEAVSHFATAVQLDPARADTRHDFGAALARQGKLAAAVRQFEEVVALDPESADAHRNLGMLLRLQGRPAEAASHLERATRIEPAHAASQNELGIVLVGLGRFDDAVVHFSAALGLDPGNEDIRRNLEAAVKLRDASKPATETP